MTTRTTGAHAWPLALPKPATLVSQVIDKAFRKNATLAVDAGHLIAFPNGSYVEALYHIGMELLAAEMIDGQMISMPVQVRYYRQNDSLLAIRDYQDAYSAFDDMIATGRPALAYAKETLSGVYKYDPWKHGRDSFELFAKKIRECR